MKIMLKWLGSQGPMVRLEWQSYLGWIILATFELLGKVQESIKVLIISLYFKFWKKFYNYAY